MTEQKAIEKLNMLDEALNFQRHDANECSLALQMSVKVLEKQIPKKVFANTKKEFTNEDFKGMRATRYYCPNCKKPISRASLFCDKCGQKVLFPTFSWSPYIEGEVQTRTMTWES